MKRIILAMYLLCSAKLLAFEWVDFFSSMRWHEFSHAHSRHQVISDLSHWYSLFQKAEQFEVDGIMRIPKIIHQIWLGGKLPAQYEQWCASWKKMNPEWEYKIWGDDDVESFGMINKDMFDATNNYGEKSDIWRYEILERLGGLYADIDEECLRPFDEIHELFDFYVGLQPLDTATLQLGIGIIGAAKNHPLLRKTIELMHTRRGIIPIVLKTGPLFFTEICRNFAGTFGLRDVVLPASYLYPCGYYQKGAPRQQWICQESYAVHHWAGSWLK
ncbi:hypothetical protein HYX58_05350 [Candidatus Dependentiae bacterium]|nr:hypothetical protein [Candidatus Dependentiae bacterium]